MEINKMICDDYIVERFIAGYASRDEKFEELKNHIVNCKKCFRKLIKLAPMYGDILEEEIEDEDY